MVLQVPLAFVATADSTYEKRGTKKVVVCQQATGFSMRSATVVIAIRPLGSLPRFSIIWKMKLGRISSAEKIALARVAPNVDNLYQANAWMTAKGWDDYTDNTIVPHIQCHNGEQVLLLVDGLRAHLDKNVIAKLKEKHNVVTWVGPPERTDLWQPVDQGAGKLFKDLYAAAQDEWLDDADNLERWEGGGLNASERRVLMAQWTNTAWVGMSSAKYNGSRWRWFEKGGCLMTADGTDDDKITPEGSVGYTFTRQQAMTEDEGLQAGLGLGNGGDANGGGGDDGGDDGDGGGAAAQMSSDSEGDLEGASEADDEDDAAAASFVISFGTALLSWPASSDAVSLVCNRHRPFDLSRERLIGQIIVYRFAHIGWGAGRIETYSTAKGVNFIMRCADGERQRVNLTEGTYAEGADGTADKMASFLPGSWVILIRDKGASIRR